MKFFVPISRSSFKVNPNYGDEAAVVHGVSTVEVRSYGPQAIVDDPEQNSRWILLEQNSSVSIYVCCSEESAEILTKKLRDKGCVRIEVSVSRKMERVPGLETTKYIFRYEDIDVRCSFCFKAFPKSRLRSDYVVYGDGASGDDFIQNVCPHCDMWNCCELELEDPEIVAAELGLRLPTKYFERQIAEGETS